MALRHTGLSIDKKWLKTAARWLVEEVFALQRFIEGVTGWRKCIAKPCVR